MAHGHNQVRQGTIGLAAGIFVLSTMLVAIVLTPPGNHSTAALFWIIGCGVPTFLAFTFHRRLERMLSHHDRDLAIMTSRSHTVDRLLEFSQIIQGAGKQEQIFESLSLFLHKELNLAGVVTIAHEADALPATSIKSSYPANLLANGSAIEMMEPALCPCMRQNLPRCFKPGTSPVRCSIDEVLRLAQDQPAYCIPFNVGRKMQLMVHMLLPAGHEWSEDCRQLAQTYVNAACSALVNLHHISEAERQSLTDSLTGLFNRRSMEQLLSREVALAERHGVPLTLVMIDMDKFKDINDGHGHAAGDHLLRSFADCVRITLRKTDMAFRYGGDEFLIALPQTTVEQARAVVQKLRQAFSAVDFSDAIAHLGHQPTLSIGVAERSVKDGIITLATLLAAADAALYEAKRNDRDCVRVYSPSAAA